MNRPIIPPVQKSIRIARAQADVFRLYTAHYGKWWPLNTHSIGGEKAINAVMEPRKGGQLYEEWNDGTIKPYGEVLVWEPPHRVVHTWYVGRQAHQASEVELRFVALSPRETMVELEHRNWEAMSGDNLRELRDRYNNGWESVFIDKFGSYAARAED